MKHLLLDLDLEPADLAAIQALPGVTVQFTPPPRDNTWREFPIELLRDKQIMLCRRPPKNFLDMRELELIQLVTVGFDHLAYLKLHEFPVRVCNARGLFDTAIAEWVCAMMINLVRDVPGMFRNQQAKVWSRDVRFHQEIRHKVLGIWGYGGIGRETARLAKALGMTVHVLSRFGVKPRENDYTPDGAGDPEGKLPDRVFLAGQEKEFLSDLDFLVLCVPRTTSTTGMVGEAELRCLKPTAYLLNVARGPIIQEAALVDALSQKRIAGAALDVHYAYPLPPEHPLWSMPNVILTPHISGSEQSTYYRHRLGLLLLENVKRFLRDEKLLNEVTKDELGETSS
jgi:phosphoglycerate dehydrogenase-like enzyme